MSNTEYAVICNVIVVTGDSDVIQAMKEFASLTVSAKYVLKYNI